MPQTPTYLLVLNNQIKFSTSLKRTLEQIGDYEVVAFTSASAAFDYLSDRPLDAAMIDFNLDDAPPLEVISRLRQKYHDVAIVLSPSSDTTRTVLKEHDLQAVIDIPISARRLIPILQKAVASAKDSLPETSPAPEGGNTPRMVKQVEIQSAETASPDGISSDAESAQEQSATLKEFSPFDLLKDASKLSLAIDEAPAHEMPAEVGQEGTSTLDVDMGELGEAEDAESLSTEEQAALVFEKLLAEEPPLKLEDSGTIRDLGQEVILADTGARQIIEILRDNKDVAPPPSTAPEQAQMVDDSAIIPILAHQFLKDAMDKDAPISALEAAASAATEMDEDEVTQHEIELGKSSIMQPIDPDTVPKIAPELAQLALRLTQASMELTAEASLLSENGQVVAASGDMPAEDIDELKTVIAGDWEANEGQSRIRFVTLESSGKDYMLFSRKTDFGYTLTMIFAGNMPLRVIRRQSDRLINALATEISEESVEASIKPSDSEEVNVYTGEMTSFSFVLLLHHTAPPLAPATAQAITAGLQNRLKKKGWEVKELLVAEDYVYVYADIPVDDARRETVAELRKIAGNLAQARDAGIEPEALWASAYLALTPGRPVPVDEIYRFIRFAKD